MKRAIVIGSGVGGLTTAILLQRRGYTVQVLEQHKRPGGLMQRFFRQGTAYDTGFHYCGGIGKNDIFRACLMSLGIFDDLDFLPLDPDGFDRLLLPDGSTFDVPVGMENYRQRLKSLFPDETGAIDQIIDGFIDAVNGYGLYRFTAKIDQVKLLKGESTTLLDFLSSHTQDKKLIRILLGQNVLYGVPATEAPMGLHALILDHFLAGAYRIKGGGDRIALLLCKKLRAEGGTIRFGARVKHIVVEGGHATGVTLQSDETLPANLVVANLHPKTLLPMLPANAVRKAYRNRVAQTRPGVCCFSLYIEMDGPIPEVGNRNIYRHRAWEQDGFFYDADRADPLFYFLTAPSESQPNARKHVLLMLMGADWQQFSQWKNTTPSTRPPEYLAKKAGIQANAIAQLLTDFPSLKERIVRVESSTPLTNHYYIGTPEGAMYGHYHSVDQMGRYRPSMLTKVRDLFMVGQSVFAPGILGSMMSGFYAVGGLCGMESIVEELRAQ